MARKAEPGILYYRMNCGHTSNRKIRLLFNEFDSDGYWIWQCLLDNIYPDRGYYFDCSDKDVLELFATDVCKKQVSLVEEVITGCLRRGLFDQSVFEMFGILSSEMIQQVYIDATRERRKKGTVIEMIEEYLLVEIPESETNISILPGKKGIIPGKNPIPPGRNPQSKVKESKVKESKVVSAPAKPAPPKKIREKEKIPEPYWQRLVDTWFDFVSEKFGEPPLFEGQDPKYLKSIAQKLKKRAAAKKIEWTEEAAVQRLKTFLDFAFAEDWIAKNFLLKTLDGQFEKIGRSTANVAKKGPPPGAMDPEVEIQQLYEQALQGDTRRLSFTSRHIEALQKKGLIEFTEEHLQLACQRRMDGLIGSNQHSDTRLYQAYQKNPVETSRNDPGFASVLYRIVVLELFYKMEKQERKKIFE